jgi:hypothetical protein
MLYDKTEFVLSFLRSNLLYLAAVEKGKWTNELGDFRTTELASGRKWRIFLFESALTY